MIYLASPYTSKDNFTQIARYKQALKAAAFLMRRGEMVFSPVVYGHALETKLQEKFDYAYWIKWSRAMLAVSTRIYVLTIPGWEESNGLKEEVCLAHSLGKPVVGYAFGPDAEDICGIDILGAFGVGISKTNPALPGSRIQPGFSDTRPG